MKLYDNWQDILKRAWSIRFMVLAGFFGICEELLPLYSDHFNRLQFASLQIACIVAAGLSRLVQQKEL